MSLDHTPFCLKNQGLDPIEMLLLSHQGARNGCTQTVHIGDMVEQAIGARFASEGWWGRQDSNLQPDRYERRHFLGKPIVYC